jgi:hypothetical protein
VEVHVLEQALRQDISPYFWHNGQYPDSGKYTALSEDTFADYLCVPNTRPVLDEECWRRVVKHVVWGVGASKVVVVGVGLAVVGVQAAWRYSLMSPLQVGCCRIGWPGRYSTTSAAFGAR